MQHKISSCYSVVMQSLLVVNRGIFCNPLGKNIIASTQKLYSTGLLARLVGVKNITHSVSGHSRSLNKYTDQPFFASTTSLLNKQYIRLYSMSTTTTSPRILTVGTGAVGAIYSWRLSKSCDITAVCRSNYNIVKEEGFNIESAKFGTEVFKPNQVARTVSECVTSEPFDYILITLKALPEIYNVAEIIAPAVTENTTIVLIQNGLGVEEPITDKFPNNPIVSIVAYIGTSQTEPGKIQMVGRESLVIGKYLAAKVDSDKQREKFVELLKKGDVEVQIVDDVERVRWQKLFWNAAFSPVCALTGMNTTQVLGNEEAMKAVKNVMGEVIDAAIANGYEFDHGEQMQAMISRTEATATNYKPSMQLDKERGSPMEIEVILGTPLKRAQAKGLSTPHLALSYSICSAANALIIEESKKPSRL